MRKSSSLFLNFVDDITQKKISVHNESSYREELLKLIPAHCLERKYGGQKADITSGFFPPDMRMPGTTMLSIAELKTKHPEAIRYVAPWGAQREAKLAE